MPRRNNGPYLADEPNANGVYEIRWTENGRSKRKSTGETDYRRAQRVYAEFILAAGDTVTEDVTVARVIDAYLADHADVMDPGSQRNTFDYLRSHFGGMRVREIEDRDVDQYRAKRAAGLAMRQDAEGVLRQGARAGDSTTRRELGMLSTAIRYCIEKRKFRDITGAPLLTLADKPHIPLPPTPPPRDKWLTRDQLRALFDACQPDPTARLTREYRYATALFYTASRKEPIETLPWDRIDLGRGLINLAEPGRRVTKKRRGWVPIADELQPILERAHRERVSDWFLDRPGPPYHAFRRAVRRAGLYADGNYLASPHVLRHTWATLAAQDGVPLLHIAGVLHDTLATVEKNYLHHCPDHLRGAVNRPLLNLGDTNDQAA